MGWAGEDELMNPGSLAGSQTGGSGAGLDPNQVPKNMLPPNVTGWNDEKGDWDILKPGDAGYDKTYGGYTTGDPNGTSDGDKWLHSVYVNQGWALPGTTEKPKTDPGGGGGGPSTPTNWSLPPGLPNWQGHGAQTAGYLDTLKQLQAARDPIQRSVLSDKFGRELQSSLEAAGHQVKVSGDKELIVDGRRYTIADWNPSGTSGYTPGNIPMDDIPTFSFDSLMRDTANPAVDNYISGLLQDPNRLAREAATPEVDAAMRDLLAHPESLDDRTVEMMKAASKDELAGMDTENQAALRRLGANSGIGGSSWMAAQELDNARNRDAALVNSNRAIDLKAAETRKGDQRAAAELGLGWANSKTNLANASAADRRALGELGQSNANAKTNRVFQAASADLSRAAATGDRLALRESVNQKAAELGIQAQTLLANHVQFKLSEATKKYGIDVDAAMRKYGLDTDNNTRLTISNNELEQADRHHVESLALALQQLDNADAQFWAKLGLDDLHFQANHGLSLAQLYEQERHNRANEDLTERAL